ncbi:MAG: hypothetical protein OXO50_02435 [Caldilineaceae bacterium]|nr:hypothetical protein [Caldilineaceae bacterium]
MDGLEQDVFDGQGGAVVDIELVAALRLADMDQLAARKQLPWKRVASQKVSRSMGRCRVGGSQPMKWSRGAVF